MRRLLRFLKKESHSQKPKKSKLEYLFPLQSFSGFGSFFRPETSVDDFLDDIPWIPDNVVEAIKRKSTSDPTQTLIVTKTRKITTIHPCLSDTNIAPSDEYEKVFTTHRLCQLFADLSYLSVRLNPKSYSNQLVFCQLRWLEKIIMSSIMVRSRYADSVLYPRLIVLEMSSPARTTGERKLISMNVLDRYRDPKLVSVE